MLFYIIIITSVILYAIPSIKTLTNLKFKKTSQFDFLSGYDIFWLLTTPLYLLCLINYSWSGPSLSIWFGNLIFTTFQYKIGFLVLLFFTLLLYSYCSVFYFSSKDIYDYTIICLNFLLWVYLLFLSNNILSFIFFIEILSTLIFLLLITSTFSTTFFYNNLNLNLYNYFNYTTPLFYIQMLMFFFWTSLVSSLNLFFFLVIFYFKFLTLDWSYLELTVYYFFNETSVYEYISFSIVWFNFLFCFFLKCGLVPFYFWKPVFFKGIPLHALSFYILFFYFFIFFFFIYFFLVYVNELFYFFIFLNTLLFVVGFTFLLFILCESYYIKAFLALSSILNTLFVFLAMNSSSFWYINVIL